MSPLASQPSRLMKTLRQAQDERIAAHAEPVEVERQSVFHQPAREVARLFGASEAQWRASGPSATRRSALPTRKSLRGCATDSIRTRSQRHGPTCLSEGGRCSRLRGQERHSHRPSRGCATVWQAALRGVDCASRVSVQWIVDSRAPISQGPHSLRQGARHDMALRPALAALRLALEHVVGATGATVDGSF